MKNPLRKRLLRELRQEMGKYLVVFILMVATIGFVSGFLVADGSMLTAYDNSFEKYNIEDGNFATEEKVYKNQQETIGKYKYIQCSAQEHNMPVDALSHLNGVAAQQQENSR